MPDIPSKANSSFNYARRYWRVKTQVFRKKHPQMSNRRGCCLRCQHASCQPYANPYLPPIAEK